MLFWIPCVALVHAAEPSADSEPSAATVVDRAVVLVGEAVVTQSDILLHAAMTVHDPSFLPILQSTIDESERDIIDATIVRQTAGRVPVYQPTRDQVDIRMTRFMDQWPTKNAYRLFMDTHGLTEDRIRVLLRRRAVVERVVVRALGTPKEDLAGWTERFDAWMTSTRASARVRRIARQGSPEW